MRHLALGRGCRRISGGGRRPRPLPCARASGPGYSATQDTSSRLPPQLPRGLHRPGLLPVPDPGAGGAGRPGAPHHVSQVTDWPACHEERPQRSLHAQRAVQSACASLPKGGACQWRPLLKRGGGRAAKLLRSGGGAVRPRSHDRRQELSSAQGAAAGPDARPAAGAPCPCPTRPPLHPFPCHALPCPPQKLPGAERDAQGGEPVAGLWLGGGGAAAPAPPPRHAQASV